MGMPGVTATLDGIVGLGPACAPPQLVECGVDRDAVAPGAEAGPVIKSGEAPHDRHECRLGGVVGIALSDHAATDRMEPVVMAAQQSLHRRTVSGLGRSDQAAIDRMVVGAAVGGRAHPWVTRISASLIRTE